MKLAKKIIVFVLILATFNSPVSLMAATVADSHISDTQYENLIAGTISLDDYATANNTDSSNLALSSANISNGIYYINGNYSGAYLHYSSSSASTASGLISSLGNSILWTIAPVSGGYVIRSSSDTTKYLSVPSSSTSASVEIMTVTSSTIPTRCLWNITNSSEGGCLIQNVYNSKYLCSAGTTLYTSAKTGTAGTSTYRTRIWRILSQSNMSGRELDSDFSIKTCYLFTGDTVTPVINKSPSNAIWASASDFTYSGYSSSYLSFDPLSGKFTDISSSSSMYSATVTATHKVTNQTATFTIVIRPKAILVGVTNTGHDHATCLETIRPLITGCGYSSATKYTGAFTSANILSYLNTNTTNVFVSRSHGDYYTGGTYIVLYNLENGDSGELFRSSTIPSSADFSNLKLAAFIACYTGYGGENAANLPSVAVARGAKSAIGFEEIINCAKANSWTVELFSLLNSGYTLKAACDYLGTQPTYENTTLASPVICGSKYITLS